MTTSITLVHGEKDVRQKAELNRLITNNIKGNGFSQQRLNYCVERNLGFILMTIYGSSVGCEVLK